VLNKKASIKKSMALMKFLLLFGISGLTVLVANAQFFYVGADNPFQKLKKIETEHYQVVFPKGFEYEGQKIANLLELTFEPVSQTLGHLPKKRLPVLLHTNTAQSNGFVSMAPSRTEWFNTSSQHPLSYDWLSLLAIHEGRHVVQFDKLEHGLPGFTKILFGDGAKGAVAGLFPMWAYEGDAVIAETALTNSGRGRSASFLMGLKAITFEKEETYSFEKAILGSYKDYVPDHYLYGYTMSATARLQHDSAFWENVLEYLPKRPFMLPPTYFAMKKHYGISRRGLYNAAMEFMEKQWENPTVDHKTYPHVNKTNKDDYISYRFPVMGPNEWVFAEKECMSAIRRFVAIDENGDEVVVALPGIMASSRLSMGGNKLVWAEVKPHPRWRMVDNSVIKVKDLTTMRTQTIGKRSMFAGPAIDVEGKKIVAIENGISGGDNLVVFDAETGQTLHVVKREGMALQLPAWDPGATKVVYTAIGLQGRYIETLDMASGMHQTLFGPTGLDLSNPIFWNNYILFSAGFDGTNNIFALETDSKKLYKVTESKYGAFDPFVNTNNSTLYFSEYTSQGYDIAFMELQTEQFQPFATEDITEPEMVGALSAQENHTFELTPDKFSEYPMENYRRWKNLVHVHSWLPFYFEPELDDIDNLKVDPGVTLFTQNLTSTLFGWTGYSYSEGNHYGHANLTYRGLWPELKLDFDIGGLPGFIPFSEIDTPEINIPNRTEISFEANLPLILTEGPVIFRIQPALRVKYNDVFSYTDKTQAYERGFFDLRYAAYFYVYTKMAKRDLYPKWGLLAQAIYFNSPYEINLGSKQTYVLRGYMPGLLEDHSLRLQFGHQQQDYVYYRYLLNFPRGFVSRAADRLQTVSAEYAFPIFYPDWRVGSILYFKRFTANLFFQRAFAQGIFTGNNNKPYINDYFTSYGIDLSTDLHFAQSFLPFSIGLRMGYLPDLGEVFYEPVFGVQIPGM
jgi:outer membrane protein assembly factor BamB